MIPLITLDITFEWPAGGKKYYVSSRARDGLNIRLPNRKVLTYDHWDLSGFVPVMVRLREMNWSERMIAATSGCGIIDAFEVDEAK